MESPQKPKERFEFPSFEHFVVRTEQKENPRRMPYIVCGITMESWQKDFNNQLRNHLRTLLQTASINKEVIDTEPNRKFLQTAWHRDNYLYFNGVYFPFRWIDSKGRNRPEREALVLNEGSWKDIKEDSYRNRILTDINEGLFTIGEGGIYFPDHDNNTLFISDAIIAEEGNLTQQELHEKIIEIHKKIFGDAIEILVLPYPDNGKHIDTHLSVIPNTKILLIENNYYEKLGGSVELKQIEKLGYRVVKIPPTSMMQCPLNILYLENTKGEISAFVNPQTPDMVKTTLRDNKITVYEIDADIANTLDASLGGVRCITNELHSIDPSFLLKLGLKQVPLDS